MTPQTITITSARGETFTMNFDGPVSVEVKDAHLSPFEVGDVTPKSPSQFAIGDTVEWTDKRLGKRSGVVTDIIGHVLNIGPHVMVWDDQARKVTPSTAPKFKVGDVVWWGETIKYYGRVTSIGDNKVYFERLTTFNSALAPVGGIGFEYEARLHHDYRTVAGGGWRKCEVGKMYKTSIKDVKAAKTHFHDENGYRVGGVNFDLIEELP